MKTPERKAQDAAWYAKHSSRIKEELRGRYAADSTFREQKKDTAQKHYEANKEKKKEQSRKSALKNQYGISVDQYKAMDDLQGGVCLICKCPPQAADSRRQRLCVDHNHMTGQIRGLLCHHCNVGLSHFQETPAILQRAIDYLNAHSS